MADKMFLFKVGVEVLIDSGDDDDDEVSCADTLAAELVKGGGDIPSVMA